MTKNKKGNDAMAMGVTIGIVIGVVPDLFTDNLAIGITVLKK